jgi:hypothetical protein
MITHFNVLRLLDTEICIRLRDSSHARFAAGNQSIPGLIFSGSPTPPRIVAAIREV